MSDRLVRAMFALGAVARPYLRSALKKLAVSNGLEERDLDVVEFVGARGTTNFLEIVKQLQLQHGKGTSLSRVSTALSKLYASHGVIDKRADPSDQRRPVVTLTEKGEQLFKEVQKLRKRVYAQVERAMRLSEKETEILATAFEEATANLKKLIEE